MFRKELKEKLSEIFGFRKTTFDQPSVNASTGSYEQETLFIQVNECKSRMTHKQSLAEVAGFLTVFAQMDKMPFGYFTKRIQQADPDLTRNLFFYDIDLNPVSSPARLQNISERRVSFVYLYAAQYDPDHGELTSIEFEIV